jgi:hypothetical protein
VSKCRDICVFANVLPSFAFEWESKLRLPMNQHRNLAAVLISLASREFFG